MTTAIDTNILVALWNEDDSLNTLARSALDDALGRGGLVIAAVFTELLAAPSRVRLFLIHSARKRGFQWIGI
jgi:predicted nucleic acid-binding protein